MRLLTKQTGRQVTATGQDQSIQLSHHRPDHPKKQREGTIIAQTLQRIIARDQRQCRNEAGQASGLQDSLHGGRITSVGGPPSISQVATCSKNANAWPLAQAKIVALLLFCYPVCKQIADWSIYSCLHASLPQKDHQSVTPTGYLKEQRLAEHT